MDRMLIMWRAQLTAIFINSPLVFILCLIPSSLTHLLLQLVKPCPKEMHLYCPCRMKGNDAIGFLVSFPAYTVCIVIELELDRFTSVSARHLWKSCPPVHLYYSKRVLLVHLPSVPAVTRILFIFFLLKEMHICCLMANSATAILSALLPIINKQTHFKYVWGSCFLYILPRRQHLIVHIVILQNLLAFVFHSLSGGWSPTGSTRHGDHWLAYGSLRRVTMMMENLVE
jgi:hypothetical protein